MALAGEKATQAEIQRQAVNVGLEMNRTLPFRRGGWLTRLAGGFVDTPKVVAEAAGGQGFTRRWLERSMTKNQADSPVRLLEDRVTVHPERSSQAAQLGQDTRVIAVYDPGTNELTIAESLGMPQSEAAERVREIGTFVTEIGNEQLAAELKQAPTLSPETAIA